MIRVHEFNTAWWGAPVGIVDDDAFFGLPSEEQRRQLAPYAWVEYRAVTERTASYRQVQRAGFFHADTQIRYRIALDKIPSTPSIEQLHARFADGSPMTVRTEEMADFRSERYRHVPGITVDRLNERYARWSNLLIEENPESCLEVIDRDVVQGWFLGCVTDKGLNLTLAMLHRDARISGLHLYQKAMTAFASRGKHVGWASFSVENVPVLNILSGLGARFTATECFWLWVNQDG